MTATPSLADVFWFSRRIARTLQRTQIALLHTSGLRITNGTVRALCIGARMRSVLSRFSGQVLHVETMWHLERQYVISVSSSCLGRRLIGATMLPLRWIHTLRGCRRNLRRFEQKTKLYDSFDKETSCRACVSQISRPLE